MGDPLSGKIMHKHKAKRWSDSNRSDQSPAMELCPSSAVSARRRLPCRAPHSRRDRPGCQHRSRHSRPVDESDDLLRCDL